jgi:polysaccharide pyruvyl transferase CsaB
MKNLLLAGYLGAGNLGDDAVMLGLVHGLGGAGYSVTVLSGAPEETHRLYGFPSVPRRDNKAIEAAIIRCDALVFPGGSIFQDASSMMSPTYYSGLVETAKKHGKKVVLVGQGIGPLKGFIGKGASKKALNMADGITVRDPSALQALKDLGVTKPARVAADSAFLLPMPRLSEEAGYGMGGMRAVALAPRPVKEKGRDIAGLFGELCKLLYQSGTMPTLLPMDRHEDIPLIDAISKAQGGKVPDLRKIVTPMEVQQRIARMDCVLAMRLHAGILAATVGVPPLMVSYDPKVTAFSKLLDLGPALPLEGLTAPRLLDAFMNFLKAKDRNVKILERKREEQAKAAELSVEMVKTIVG